MIVLRLVIAEVLSFNAWRLGLQSWLQHDVDDALGSADSPRR